MKVRDAFCEGAGFSMVIGNLKSTKAFPEKGTFMKAPNNKPLGMS
jgi:hypothetical protein